METSQIILWGSVALTIVVVLGLLLSKRNSSKKVGSDVPKECPVKEVMSEDEEEKVNLCSRCNICEATEEWNDAAVCEDCFEELDEEDDEDDWPKGKTSEYVPTEYSGSGFDLTSLIMGLVVLGITLTIGMAILGSLRDAVGSGAFNNTSSNATVQVFESFSAFGSWLPMIFMVGMGAIVLATVMRAFGRSYDGL